jgi:hypothetical protein
MKRRGELEGRGRGSSFTCVALIGFIRFIKIRDAKSIASSRSMRNGNGIRRGCQRAQKSSNCLVRHLVPITERQ